ncbi:MAG: asparagine--tRNA ligase [Planctomycetota bacterium]|nr:asparagine--tRNA ligase [Planctomycetota bacterium]
MDKRWIYIGDAAKHCGEEVEIRGWLYNRRRKGKLLFLLVRDGTGIVQCIGDEKSLGEEEFSELDHLPLESSLIVKGVLKEEKRAPGGFEMNLLSAKVIHKAEEYPIGKKEHGIEFLMKHRHLWIRSKRQVAILRVRSRVVRSIYDFFFERGFVLFDAPILTPTSCEGTTTLFEVNYFDDKAYLTQSGQLYGEAGAMALGKIFVFGPTFRAEKSKTRKHLTEFWMVEPEVAFADLNDMIELGESLISHIVREVVSNCGEELLTLERNIDSLRRVEPPFPRMKYEEVVALLQKKGADIKWGDDFGAPEESMISESFDKPVVIHRFPKEMKAFYMKEDPEDSRLALGFDVIAPEGYGEIIGGGQRADDLNYILSQIEKHNLPQEVFKWYLDLRRYGSVPHSGFGLGLERTVAWLCGTEHIRETIPFPRMLYTLYP